METIEKEVSQGQESSNVLKKLSTFQLLNFCLGFFGLQFAWQMRIVLSGPVTEPLGASPFIFSLIWLAGPITGLVVQPIIGAMSDSMGKRKPFLLIGGILASLGLWGLPHSEKIADAFAGGFGMDLPSWSALLIAAAFIWIIDACVNAAQGPYRALVPDIAPQEQHSLANAYLSFAIGLGSVIAAGTAPFLKFVFGYQMNIESQFLMAALAFTLAVIWTCVTTPEGIRQKKSEDKKEIQPSFAESFMSFFSGSKEIYKICAVQFLTWMGVMSLFIYFTQFAIHNIFGVPDLAGASESVIASFAEAKTAGEIFSGACFTWFNLVCFLVSIPIGIVSSKIGNKPVHIFSLVAMGAAFLGLAFTTNTMIITALMAVAGIGWASILALPFAMLTKYIKKGTEGSIMGIFNIFIAGPQILVCTVLGWIIMNNPMQIEAGLNYHWEYAFLIGGVAILLAAALTTTINENEAIEIQE